VIHSQSLRQLVNYESSSMQDWSIGYGLQTEKPSNDILRRFNAVVNLSTKKSIHRILDVGCGEGVMVKKFAESFHAEGIEPEKHARDFCTSSGLCVHSGLESLEKNGELFDLISLFHVIEHVYQPSELLIRLKALLNPHGILLIETPNSMDALLTKYENTSFQNFTYWSHHPMLYSPHALSSLVARCGFNVIENNGIQRYGLENHMYWLAKGLPGGHEVWHDLFDNRVNDEYARNLVAAGISDALWLVATRN
jgi:SAM-dependent methyltransferase